MIKTIGDAVMIVGSDPAALADWAVGVPAPRAPGAAGRGSPSTTERAVPRRRLLRARCEYRLARRGEGRRRRGARDHRSSSGPERPRVRADRRRPVEGASASRPRFSSRASGRAAVNQAAGVRARARGRACLHRGPPRGRAAVGGRDRRACSTSRSAWPVRERRHGTACELWDTGSRTKTSAIATSCARASGSSSGYAGRRGRPSSGNLQAWARESRYREAAERPGRRGRRGRRPHATDQVETILYRLALRRRAGGRCSACARARAAWSGRCSGSRARRPRRTARSGGCGGARTTATLRRSTPATAIRAELVPALRGVHAGGRGQRARGGADPARGGGGARRTRRRGSGAKRRPCSLAGLRALALGAAAARGPADGRRRRRRPRPGRGRPRRGDRGAERRTERSTLDVGDGLRAVAEYGALRFEPLGTGSRCGGGGRSCSRSRASVSFGSRRGRLRARRARA